MQLTTSLEGRVRNTSLPRTNALLPVMEAVVNSIQAIDVRPEPAVPEGFIEVRVERGNQDKLFPDDGTAAGRARLDPITSFVITDNGVGFTDENMSSFQTLDSDFKAPLGCRGVGRLLWLRAFDHASIDSAYCDNSGHIGRRRFTFSVSSGVSDTVETAADAKELKTEIRLVGFRSEYQKHARKTLDAIARDIFEHCLWYFLRPAGSPKILVSDDDDSIDLDDLMQEYVHDPSTTTHITVKSIGFDLVSIRCRARNLGAPTLHWCAASRVVSNENLTGRLPGLHSRLRDEIGEFTYEGFLSSEFLDHGVRFDRLAFDIPESVDGTLEEGDLALADVRAAALKEIDKLFKNELKDARREEKKRVRTFIEQKAPRYRPVLSRLDEIGLTVDPTMKDRELEFTLHRALQAMDHETLKEGQEVLANVAEWEDNDYQARLNKYLTALKDINQSDLAAYVARRRTVLDLLKARIQIDSDGKYALEDAIHTLLMPMRTDSDHINPDAANLWIIDERLAFHDYLASDTSFRAMPVTESDSLDRPDILALKVNEPFLVSNGDQPSLVTIDVIEIKRPMRNDMTKDDRNPINQALNYVKGIRAGGVKTPAGRLIKASKDAPAFCYILADMTDSMVNQCENSGLIATQDGQGFFGYFPRRSAYVEVISFDGLVYAATQRNRAFFDKLGLPTT